MRALLTPRDPSFRRIPVPAGVKPGPNTVSCRPESAKVDKSDKSGDFAQKCKKVVFRTLFRLFSLLLGVLPGLLATFTHLFQELLLRNPLSGRLKVTFLTESDGIENRPIGRQEFHLWATRPDPGLFAASRGSESDRITRNPRMTNSETGKRRHNWAELPHP